MVEIVEYMYIHVCKINNRLPVSIKVPSSGYKNNLEVLEKLLI